MKKIYSKPEIAFESFTPCTNIAAGCEETNVTHSAEQYGCGYLLDEKFNYVVFMSSKGCNTTEDDGDYNGLCYHTPVDSSNLFAS